MLHGGSCKLYYNIQFSFLLTELWSSSLWDPLYTPAVANSTLFNTATSSEEVNATPVSVWGSSVSSLWSSSPWSTVTASVATPISAAPGHIVPPISIPVPRHEVPQNIIENNAADIDVSILLMYGLFNAIVSGSGCIVGYGRVISE